jgi:hypothetical protein
MKVRVLLLVMLYKHKNRSVASTLLAAYPIFNGFSDPTSFKTYCTTPVYLSDNTPSDDTSDSEKDEFVYKENNKDGLNDQAKTESKTDLLKMESPSNEGDGIETAEAVPGPNDEDNIDLSAKKNKHQEQLIHPPFYINSESEIMDSSIQLSEEANETFKVLSKNKEKYTIPDVRLSHFKSKSNAELLVSQSRDMFFKWQTFKFIQNVYTCAILRAFLCLVPVPSQYIKEISQSIISNKDNYSNPVLMMCPSINLSMASSIYGIAQGGYDLIHHIPSKFRKMELAIKYNTNVNGPPSDVGIKYYSEPQDSDPKLNVNYPIDNLSFKINSPRNLNTFNNRHTGYTKGTYAHVLKHLYNMVCNVNVTMLINGVSERRAFILKDASSTRYEEGSMIVESLADSLDYTVLSMDLTNLFAGILRMKNKDFNFSEVSENEILNYAATVVHNNISKLIKTVSDSVITGFTFTLKMESKINNVDLTSGNTFRAMVRNGNYVPITPLHYSFYFNELSDLWYKHIFLAAVSCYPINEIADSILPRIDSKDKNSFVYYVNNKNRLKSDYYKSDFELAFQKKNVFQISFDDFIVEMFVRCVKSTPTPDYIMYVSEGEWKCPSGNSLILGTGDYNEYFCKYGLANPEKHMDELCQSMLMIDSKGASVVPYYIKKSTRVVEFLPGLYHIFVPSSDLSDGELNDDDDKEVSSFYKIK